MSYISAHSHKPPDSKGIAMTAAIHAGIVVAVLAYPATTIIAELEPDILKTFNVEPEPANPPPSNEPVVETPRIDRITDPIVPVPLPEQPQTPFAEIDTGSELTGSGDGIDIPIEVAPIPPIAEPVITKASLNSSYARQFQPGYPSGQLRLGNEALVKVRVLVGTNGRAKQMELISAPHYDFWRATRRHGLKKWRFAPATEDGTPVESWIVLTVRFEIND